MAAAQGRVESEWGYLAARCPSKVLRMYSSLADWQFQLSLMIIFLQPSPYKYAHSRPPAHTDASTPSACSSPCRFLSCNPPMPEIPTDKATTYSRPPARTGDLTSCACPHEWPPKWSDQCETCPCRIVTLCLHIKCRPALAQATQNFPVIQGATMTPSSIRSPALGRDTLLRLSFLGYSP